MSNPKPSLVRAELRRLWLRRFVRGLLLLAGTAYLVTVAVTLRGYEKTTPEALAEARASVNLLVVEQTKYFNDCIKALPADQDPDQVCGTMPTAENFGGLENFLPRQPFSLATDAPTLSLVFGFAAAALAFLIGITFIGAEWSTKSIAAWLTWEPRRLRVMTAKITALAGAVAASAVVVQVVCLGTSYLLGVTRGSTVVPVNFWGELWAQQGRLVIFAVLAALGGYALANLTRSSGAALGIAFLYLALIEPGVTWLSRPAQQWLLTYNSLAFVQPRGFTVTWVDQESFNGQEHEIFLSHWRSGITIGLATTVVLALGIVLFQRRDLS